jgi:phosphosulfolactate synthase
LPGSADFRSADILCGIEDVASMPEPLIIDETQRGFERYLRGIGVADLSPATSPFDPGVAPIVLESHLAQSAHLMQSLKVSMACWMIAAPAATRRKVAATRAAGVTVQAGGGPYEVAVAQRQLPAYLDLCADVGFDAIECGSGFTDADVNPAEIVSAAAARGLAVSYELGKKHGGEFEASLLPGLIDEGRRWLDAGARIMIVEARESGAGVGLFGAHGELNEALAEQLVSSFGLGMLIFEAPTKLSQFSLLNHFGPRVQLANVRLDELLRVEIYRRGLHSDAFSKLNLRPQLTDASPPDVRSADASQSAH